MGELRSLLRRRDMELALASGTTVAGLMEELCRQLGDRFRQQVFRPDGVMPPYVSVFVNGDDIKGLAGLETTLAGGEVDVLILPTYGGG